jgi:hypothetical protein
MEFIPNDEVFLSISRSLRASAVNLINDTCDPFSSCNSCVDQDGCNWCPAMGQCMQQGDMSCSDDVTTTCSSPEYIVIIFIVILVVLVCLCFGTCYWRKFRGFEEDMLAPLLPQQARNFLWRNSLQDQGAPNYSSQLMIIEILLVLCRRGGVDVRYMWV